MPDVTLELVPWPEGTQVGAYPRRSEQHLDDMPPTMVPVKQTAAVTGAALRYTGLDKGEYWAAAPLGDVWRYVSFNAEEDAATPVEMPGGPAPYAYGTARALSFIESMLLAIEQPYGESTITADQDYPSEWTGAVAGTFALRESGDTYTVEAHVITDVDYLIDSQPADPDGTFTFLTSQPGAKRFVLRRDSDQAMLAEYAPPFTNVRSYIVNEGQPGYGTKFVEQSYVYDQAVALCAALALGESLLAQRLAQGLLNLQTSGGVHDGGFIFSGRQIAPIYGDPAYRTGAHAIALYALTSYLAAFPGDRSRPFGAACDRACDWLRNQMDPGGRWLVTGGWGVYTPDGSGGQDFDPDVRLDWMSLEHNFDAYHALKLYDSVRGGVAGIADLVGEAIQTLLWDADRGKFLQGVKGDGTPDTADPLDAHSWGAIFCLSVGDPIRAEQIMASAQLAPYQFTRPTPEGVQATGYSVNYDEPGYPGAVPTVWSEGTFGVAYAFARMGAPDRWAQTMDGIVPSQSIDGSYYYVTDVDASQDLYPYRSTIGAAWSILAALGHGIWGVAGNR